MDFGHFWSFLLGQNSMMLVDGFTLFSMSSQSMAMGHAIIQKHRFNDPKSYWSDNIQQVCNLKPQMEIQTTNVGSFNDSVRLYDFLLWMGDEQPSHVLMWRSKGC